VQAQHQGRDTVGTRGASTSTCIECRGTKRARAGAI
jgi:hypothetical protein